MSIRFDLARSGSDLHSDSTVSLYERRSILRTSTLESSWMDKSFITFVEIWIFSGIISLYVYYPQRKVSQEHVIGKSAMHKLWRNIRR